MNGRRRTARSYGMIEGDRVHGAEVVEVILVRGEVPVPRDDLT